MIRILAAALLAALTLSCSEGSDSAPEPASRRELTLYSGRNEKLIQPLIDRFRSESGIDVNVRYGETAELAATLLEEGAKTPADVFLAQDAAALGALEAAGMLRAAPRDMLARLEPRFRSRSGRWVGLSGRARTLVYDPARLREDQLPQSLDATTDRKWRRRFGVAPTNGSFQAHMAVYQIVHGPERLERLLAGMAANQPRRYPNNSSIVRAVLDGEIDWGLVNHYYLWQARRDRPDAGARNFFMPEGDASSFVNLAAAGLLSDEPAAVELLRYLLSDDAQRYFAEETFEYPLAGGIEPAGGLVALDEIRTPEVDFAEIGKALPEALGRINESGLVQ